MEYIKNNYKIKKNTKLIAVSGLCCSSTLHVYECVFCSTSILFVYMCVRMCLSSCIA